MKYVWIAALREKGVDRPLLWSLKETRQGSRALVERMLGDSWRELVKHYDLRSVRVPVELLLKEGNDAA